jgi:hypothetical protein
MKLASLVFGDNPKKADSNKLSSPQPGQIVRTADGSTYRVASKLAGPDGTVLKLANLQGKPVPTPANFRPVGMAMTRFASWMRYHLAYNADFDLYINSYIDRYNEQHPKQPLPYAIGPDGKPFRWADWFQNNINPRLNVPGDPASDSVQDAKDELIHEMLFTTLGHRNILEDFRKKLPSFMTKNDKVKNMEVGRQLTHFLVKSFQFRIEEMNNKYREKNPAEEVSMYQPAEEENEEGLTEVNILDSEEHGVGEAEFESAEAKKDVAKFSQGLRVWLQGAYGEKAAGAFGLMFDIFWRMLSQEGGSEIKRGELEQEWMQKTGLSFGSFKDYFARLPEVIEQYITSQEIEMGDQNIFVDLMNVIKKERTKRLRQERRQKEKARPAMVSSLHTAGIEGDIAEAIGEVVSPATVDKDIAQPTVSVPEAAKVSSLYRILADSLAPNERMVTPEQAQVYIDSIRPGDRVTILVPAGRGMNGQEWSESTGKAVMRSAHGGWVLNMGGRHGTPGIADARNIVSVRPSKRASYSKQAETVETPHGAMTYEPRDVVNPDDYIAKGDFNPHNVRPWLIHNEFGTLAIVYANNEQDALDEAVDGGKMDSCMVSREDWEESQRNQDDDYAMLGNASEPFDLTYVGMVPLPNQQYGVSEVETEAMMEGMESQIQEGADQNFKRDMGIQGSLKIAKLLRGDSLTPEMIKQVKDAFIYRWTLDNPRRAQVYHCDKCDVANDPYVNTQSAEGHQHPTIPLQSDDEWLAEHAFYFTNAGKLQPQRHAQPAYLAQQNPDNVFASDMKFALEKAAAPATPGGQLPCCGGWHGMHRDNCSVREENDKKTFDMLKSLGKRGMLGHDFSDADHQAITNETLPDTGMRPHVYDDAELKSGSIEACPHCKSAHIEVDASADGFEVYCDSCDGVTGKYAAGSNSGKDDARGAGDLWREEFYESNEAGPSAKALFGADKQAVDEQWAEDHGYWHGTCPIHGSFWTDGTGCESCQEEERHAEPEEGQFRCDNCGEIFDDSQKHMDEKWAYCPKCIVEFQSVQASAKRADTVTMQTQNATIPNVPGKGEPMAVPESIDQTAGPHSPNAPATAPRTPGIQPKIVNVPQGTEGEADKTVQSSFKLKVTRKKRAAEKCKECGEPLNNAEGTYCGACLAQREEDRHDPFDKEAAPAPAAPVVSPNVEQNLNINRPQMMAPTPGATMAIMPGQNEEEGGIKRHTVEPELPNAKYHMQGAQQELVAAEEERLMKQAFGRILQCQECGKIDPSVEVVEIPDLGNIHGTGPYRAPLCPDCADDVAQDI